jgi:RecA/RadA recombinase
MSKRGRPFRFLNVDDIAEDATVGVFGPRGCGKTTVMLSILRAKQLSRGMVMCPTPEAFVTYSEYVPLPYIYDKFDEPALERIMKYQKSARFRLHQIWRHEMAQLEMAARELRARRFEDKMVRLQERAQQKGWTDQQIQIAYQRAIVDDEAEEKQNNEIRMKYGRQRANELRKPYMMFIIMDDLSSDKATMRSELLKKLINNGRHFMLLLFIAVQYAIDFPAACRGGLDWVAIHWDSIGSNLERIYHNFVGIFPDLASFKVALSEACRQGCCMFIKKNVPSTDPWDCVFFYKAQRGANLASSYFGDDRYAFVANMFLDEEKFRAAEGAVRDTDDKAAGQKSKGRKKAPKAEAPAKGRKKAAKEEEEDEVDAVAAWDDDEVDDARNAAEKAKQERNNLVKQGVAQMRKRIATVQVENVETKEFDEGKEDEARYEA